MGLGPPSDSLTWESRRGDPSTSTSAEPTFNCNVFLMSYFAVLALFAFQEMALRNVSRSWHRQNLQAGGASFYLRWLRVLCDGLIFVSFVLKKSPSGAESASGTGMAPHSCVTYSKFRCPLRWSLRSWRSLRFNNVALRKERRPWHRRDLHSGGAHSRLRCTRTLRSVAVHSSTPAGIGSPHRGKP